MHLVNGVIGILIGTNSTRYSRYLEDYYPCAGGISTVNAIGTKLRDLINSGLTR